MAAERPGPGSTCWPRPLSGRLAQDRGLPPHEQACPAAQGPGPVPSSPVAVLLLGGLLRSLSFCFLSLWPSLGTRGGPEGSLGPGPEPEPADPPTSLQRRGWADRACGLSAKWGSWWPASHSSWASKRDRVCRVLTTTLQDGWPKQGKISGKHKAEFGSVERMETLVF